MKLLSNRRHRVAAAVTVAAVAVGGGAAAITAISAPSPAGAAALTASTGSAAKTAPAAGSHAARAHRRGHLLARADHAAVEVHVKGKWVTLDLDRGKVTSVSSSAITLARRDGQSVTLKVDSATKLHGVTSVAAITDGSRVQVLSEAGTARRIAEKAHTHSATAPSTTSSGAATPA